MGKRGNVLAPSQTFFFKKTWWKVWHWEKRGNFFFSFFFLKRKKTLNKNFFFFIFFLFFYFQNQGGFLAIYGGFGFWKKKKRACHLRALGGKNLLAQEVPGRFAFRFFRSVGKILRRGRRVAGASYGEKKAFWQIFWYAQGRVLLFYVLWGEIIYNFFWGQKKLFFLNFPSGLFLF